MLRLRFIAGGRVFAAMGRYLAEEAALNKVYRHTHLASTLMSTTHLCNADLTSRAGLLMIGPPCSTLQVVATTSPLSAIERNCADCIHSGFGAACSAACGGLSIV